MFYFTQLDRYEVHTVLKIIHKEIKVEWWLLNITGLMGNIDFPYLFCFNTSFLYQLVGCYLGGITVKYYFLSTLGLIGSLTNPSPPPPPVAVRHRPSKGVDFTPELQLPYRCTGLKEDAPSHLCMTPSVSPQDNETSL